jgi:hypothetical protein
MRCCSVRALLFAALIGCVITRPPHLDERPRWQVVGDPHFESPCILGRAFVRKSGKQGIGVSLQLKSRMDCRVQIRGHLAIGGGDVAIADQPVVEMHGRSLRNLWLPVPFDGNDAWNAGHVDATLALALVVDGVAQPTWSIPIHDADHENKLP